MEQRVINCEGDQKKVFSLIHSLLGSKKITVLPEYTSSFTLACTMNMFFIDNINTIKMEFLLLEACLPVYYIYIYILSVYSPFSDRVGLPLHNIHIPSQFTSIVDIFVDLKFGNIRFYTL